MKSTNIYILSIMSGIIAHSHIHRTLPDDDDPGDDGVYTHRRIRRILRLNY